MVKWLLSLDLSYSIKVPKRDLSNGFLVAEILSKYFPEEFSMHSYVNGTSSISKNSNWALLQKQMKKVGVRCSADEVAHIVAAEGDAAMDLLTRLFNQLHKHPTSSRGGQAVAGQVRNPRHLSSAPGAIEEAGDSYFRSRAVRRTAHRDLCPGACPSTRMSAP